MAEDDETKAKWRLQDLQALQAAEQSYGAQFRAQQAEYQQYWSANPASNYIDCQGYPPARIENIVHHFTGAPKSEAKSVPCGAALVSKDGHGFRLAGLTASTEIDAVTCLGCLRALIPTKGR